jgi:hypothetical protein
MVAYVTRKIIREKCSAPDAHTGILAVTGLRYGWAEAHVSTAGRGTEESMGTCHFVIGRIDEE